MNRHNKRTTVAVEAPAQSRKTDWGQVAGATDPETVRTVVASQMQAWGGGFLMLGVLQLLPGTTLDHVWGVILLLVAAMSFYFSNGALLATYGVLLGWAMVSNLLTGELLWMGLAVLQAYWVFRTFQQFAILRRTATRLGIGLEANSLHRADKVLPWVGFAFTAAGWVGFGLWWAVLFWYAFNEQSLSEEAIGAAFTAMIDLAVLGLALAVAALAARYRFRLVSILAVLGAVLLLVSFAAMVLLGS